MLIISIISYIVAIPFFSYSISLIIVNRITCIIIIYSALLTYNTIYYDSLASGINIYSGLFYITIISQSREIFLLFTGTIILFNWRPTIINKLNINLILKNNVNYITILPKIKEFYLIILFTIIGSNILICSYDIISIFLSLELQSFAIYIIATIYRNSESATYAGLKYYLLGRLSSTFILLGIAFIYNYTGITQFENLYSIIQVINLLINNFIIHNGFIFGFILISIGFLFKIAAAPIHNWAPDVYDGTPMIITIWLTTIPKISILIFFLHILTIFENINIYSYFDSVKNLLLFSSFLSIIIGSIIGLNQIRIKRLFTYSTINHIGFILLRLSINTEESVESFIFYLIQYSIINVNIYSILLAFGYIIHYNITIRNKNYLEIEYIQELKGQFKYNPLLCISLALSLFSLAGVPPLIGFFAKQIVLYTSIYNGYYFLSLIAIIISVISVFYYLKIVRIIFFDKDEYNSLNYNYNSINYITITNIHSILISILTIRIILFILNPSILLNSCYIIALSIYYN